MRPKARLLFSQKEARERGLRLTRAFVESVGLSRSELAHVLVLYDRGLSTIDIAYSEKMQQTQVDGLINRVVAARSPRANGKATEIFEDNPDRVALLLLLEAEGKDMRLVAWLLRTSPAVACYASARLDRYKEASLQRRSLVRLTTLASKLGISPEKLRTRCERWGIPILTRLRRSYIAQRDVKSAKTEFAVSALCRRCHAGRPTVSDHDQQFSFTCEDCKRKHEQERCKARYARQKRTGIYAKTHRGWLALLPDALAKNTPPEGEILVGAREAGEIAGLNPPRLTWVTNCGLVATRSHPTKRHRGRPCCLYSPHQMRIVRELRENFGRVSTVSMEIEQDDSTAPVTKAPLSADIAQVS